MTREQWLEMCWRDLREDVERVAASKDRRGGQHVPCFSGLANCAPSAINELRRWCRSALDTTAEYYETVEAPKERGDG